MKQVYFTDEQSIGASCLLFHAYYTRLDEIIFFSFIAGVYELYTGVVDGLDCDNVEMIFGRKY